MGTKVRDIVGTGEPFKGSLARAIGCGNGHRFAGEFTVMEVNGKTHHVCKEHLALQCRESIVGTGSGIMVFDAEIKGECQYAGVA